MMNVKEVLDRLQAELKAYRAAAPKEFDSAELCGYETALDQTRNLIAEALQRANKERVPTHVFYAECCNPECKGQWGAGCPHCHQRDHVCQNFHGEEIARIRRETITEILEMAKEKGYSGGLLEEIWNFDTELKERAELARLKAKYE